MKQPTKVALLKEINRIIKVIKAEQYSDNFVCVIAGGGPVGDEVRKMVRRHIGSAGTMNCFLDTKKVKDAYLGRVADAYRLLMLDNMKKMVRKEYK